ncbi:hypothetical protein [Aestuariibacter salexigens]|uniref:hypothetical protein n=1 Tax=Aestuariibacter salexigens TaxID=226010 RepID=UPI00047CF480|nr:hypothetical protein [Aestuariibacter salexigens]
MQDVSMQSYASSPVTINVGGKDARVLVVPGAGINTTDLYNSATTLLPENAVYLIDDDSGHIIWSVSQHGAALNMDAMQFSINTKVSLVDHNYDGHADLFYVIDTQGQVFRFDIHNGAAPGDLISGGLLAQLHDPSHPAVTRHYFPVDVTEVSSANERYNALVVGSRVMENPDGNAVYDEVIMVRDASVFKSNDSGESIVPPSPVSRGMLKEVASSTIDLQAGQYSGWRLALNTLQLTPVSAPVIINYQVLFTAYVNNQDCHAYLVARSLIDGEQTARHNTISDERMPGSLAEIPERLVDKTVSVLVSEKGYPSLCVGELCAPASVLRDDEGQVIPCDSSFACLAESVFGMFNPVQRGSWSIDVER